MAEWTFLTKHALVLSLIGKHPHITGRELAEAIGTTKRQIRKIIADLFSCGYIDKEKVGRGVEYRSHASPLYSPGNSCWIFPYRAERTNKMGAGYKRYIDLNTTTDCTIEIGPVWKPVSHLCAPCPAMCSHNQRYI